MCLDLLPIPSCGAALGTWFLAGHVFFSSDGLLTFVEVLHKIPTL